MDISSITKSVTVTRGLPEQVERIQELEKENQQLRAALSDMIQLVRKEYGSNDVKVQAAEAVLKGKENDGI